MAKSKVDIANMALSYVAAGGGIQSLEESSDDALAVTTHYDDVLATLLREHPWNFARRYLSLALLADVDLPSRWTYPYAYPADCVEFRGIDGETEDLNIPFEIAYGAGARIIFTNIQDAIGVYTALVEDPVYYPPDFTTAFARRLADAIAPRVTGGDHPELIRFNADRMLTAVDMAKVKDALENRVAPFSSSDRLRGRRV